MKPLKTLFKPVTLILWVTSLVFLSSCTKKETEEGPCLAIFAPDQLLFSVVDQNTGADLFFSATPTYTTDQIYAIFGNQTAQVKPKVENPTGPNQHFSFNSINSDVSGFLKLYIAGQLKFTIIYTMKKENSSNCSRYVFDQLTINGTQTEQNLKDRVIKLKL